MRNTYSEITQDYTCKHRILKSPQFIRDLKQVNSDLSQARQKLDTSLNIQRAITPQ